MKTAKKKSAPLAGTPPPAPPAPRPATPQCQAETIGYHACHCHGPHCGVNVTS